MLSARPKRSACQMEKLVLELKNVTVTFGNKDILDSVNLTVYENERIGIVGRNGQGKTTLLNIISGHIQPTIGWVESKETFNYFEQIPQKNTYIKGIEGEWMSRFAVPNNPLSTLSGGEVTKLRLSQTFSQYQIGLLLDEPTTHLDKSGIDYLVQELEYYYGTLLIVSHDRYFLDRLATKIWEVEGGKVTEYSGNYSDYCKQKAYEEREQERLAILTVKEKDRLEKAIQIKNEKAAKVAKVSDKNKNRNIKPSRLNSSKQKDTVQKSLHKSAKALESRLGKIEDISVKSKSQKIIFPSVPGYEMHNRFPIRGDQLTLFAGGNHLLDKADFQFSLGKKIAIVGDNGTGKSTLLNAILEGHKGIIVSQKAQFSTYHQMDYRLEKNVSVLDYLMQTTEYKENMVRALLNNLGFSQGAIQKPIHKLSGGEATRVALAAVFTKPSNIVVLDEPTNFIDIQTIAALEDFIVGYPGTVIFTSHDKVFINNVADQVWRIDEKKLVLTSGEIV